MKGNQAMLKKTVFSLTLLLFLLTFAHAENTTGVSEKFPFYPSLLNTNTGKLLKTEDFEDPEVCSGCHTDIYNQWKGSMHSSAFHDPVFQALWKVGEKETKGFTRQLCGGCHAGVGVVSNDLTFKDGEFQTSDIAKEGVHCDVCHTAKKSSFLETPTYEPQNASIVLDPQGPKRGPYKDSESPHHETAYSELHTKSVFCANCHNVFHPVSNFHIERTYDEWKFSVYAQNDIQCQDCHMMPVEKAIETAKTLKKPRNPGKPCISGPERDNMFTHEFVGANFTVPALLGYKKHAGIAEARLKSAAELDLIAPALIKTGDMATVSVKVTNVGAGHNLPTSLTEVRQMWLDVRVADVNGNEIYRSGRLDDKGNIEKGAVIFNAYAVDKDGRHTVKPWEITRFEYNKTIPPKGSATESFSFLVPRKIKGSLDVKAVLRYRSYAQAVANLLLGPGAPTLPIVDMAEKSIQVKIN
jgi:hypothetical protein